jgi:hypothetical protein
MAAQRLGLTELPVVALDHLTEIQKRAYIIADDRPVEAAGWDEKLLTDELAALERDAFHLDLVGFADDVLGLLFADPDPESTGNTDEDAASEEPEYPVSVSGAPWILGNHRVLCGDATAPVAVRRTECDAGGRRPDLRGGSG